MEELADRLSVDDAGYQRILIARDYVNDEDLVRARAQLARIHRDYLQVGIQKHIKDSQDFAAAVALLIDTFGLDLSLTRSQGLLA
jgi:hypothetical protein